MTAPQGRVPSFVKGRRRLIRTRDLSDFRRTLRLLAMDADSSPLPARRALILPTGAAIETFRQTLERDTARTGRPTLILPQLLTRDDWLERLHHALPDTSAMLTRFEREVMMERAAQRARARARMPKAPAAPERLREGGPFEIRPGLVAEMLSLYDELRRRQRTIRRFVGVLFDELGGERGTDRGSENLIHQTCLLAFAFLGYERARAQSGALDEHELRRRAGETGFPWPFDHLVVAVADHPSDPRGLWPADFDLLGRAGRTLAVDVVVTDEMHDAGFRERIEQELPGIQEARSADLFADESSPTAYPILIRPSQASAAPRQGSGRPERESSLDVARDDRELVERSKVDRRAPSADADALCAVHRDREEELRDVARAIRAASASTGHELREPTAVVFQRPLPYVYLAQQVFVDARVPFQALDALPLAGEPYAALLDLTLEVARTGGLRQSMVSLLRSPLLQFEVHGETVSIDDAAALDVVLSERRAAGEPEEYPGEVDRYFGGRSARNGLSRERALRAAHASVAIARALAPVREQTAAPTQLRTLSGFLRQHERVPADESLWRERFLRGRAAVLAVVEGLAEASARHDDRPRDADSLTAMIHHWIERHTFAPQRTGAGGVRLLDAVAARFGEFDHVHVVGLVENEWPTRMRRSIFYTTGLLRLLGWPQERDQSRAQQAAFRDLMGLPARTIQLHGFMLEGDTVVALSPFVELARGVATREPATNPRTAVFPDELLTADPPIAAAAVGEATAWLQARTARPPLTDRRYSGFVGAQPPQAYRVSRVDRYVDCPFKYFSENVLGLPEEREEQSGLSPLERGGLVHTLFEKFYRAWHDAGHRTITPGTLPVALEMFGTLAREELARLPAADRALEEVRLLGSIVARGMAERIFELEADAGGEIVDRLLEFVLKGAVTFPRMHGLDQRVIEISGKADRIDVFKNGDLRVVDYKLSRLPDTDTSIQIAAYAHAVQQMLEAAPGEVEGPRLVTQAMYLAFGDERQTAGQLATAGPETVAAVAARASEFADVVDRIERGEFPARPLRLGDCSWCRYAGVCRKEYLIESPPNEDDATEPL